MRILLPGTALAALALASSSAHAQSATAIAEPANADGLTDIVVTAQRREQKSQSAGVALTVISSQRLRDTNATKVNDIENIAPNLEVDSAYGGGQPQFRLRGVGFKDYAANNASTVGVYVDEVAYPYGSMTQGVLFDIARIEVLRGPQGTLYGRNTTGGAVNIITANPTDVWSAGVDAEYGKYSAFKGEGYVSGPINDTLKFRISGVTEQGGAWQTNRDTGQHLGDADRWAGRAKLEWDPSANSSFVLNGHYARDKSDGLGLYLTAPFVTKSGNTPPGATIPADTKWGDTGWSISPAFAAFIGAKANAKPFRDNKDYGVDLTGKINLGAAQLTSISAWEHENRGEFNDWDASSSREADTYFFGTTNVLSQELRLSSTPKGPFQWVSGVYYSHETLDGGFLSDFTDAYNPGFFTTTAYRQRVDAVGVFGQANYALTDRLSLVGGLRYEYEKRKLRGFYTLISTAAAPTSPPADANTSMSQVTGKIGLEFRAAPGILLYADAARGVKSGGFTTYNKGSVSNDQLIPFKPEVLWAYEVGAKTDLGRTLRVNASAFYYDYKNQQVQASIVSPQYGPIGKLVNAPKSEIYGGELEIVWEPIAGLTINQALGYKHGEYKQFSSVDNAATRAARDPITRLYNTVVVVDRAGERLPFPQFDYTGQVAYSWLIGGGRLRAESDYVHRSDLYSTTATSVIRGYWVANASLTLTKDGAPWSIGVFGNNIFNAHYDETRNQFTNAATASPHEPVTYGVRVGYHF